MKIPYTSWRDRLANVPTWRLWWALVTPIGFCLFWLVLSARSGDVGFTVAFAVLLAMSVVVVGTAMILRIRARGQRPDSN